MTNIGGMPGTFPARVVVAVSGCPLGQPPQLHVRIFKVGERDGVGVVQTPHECLAIFSWVSDVILRLIGQILELLCQQYQERTLHSRAQSAAMNPFSPKCWLTSPIALCDLLYIAMSWLVMQFALCDKIHAWHLCDLIDIEEYILT